MDDFEDFINLVALRYSPHLKHSVNAPASAPVGGSAPRVIAALRHALTAADRSPHAASAAAALPPRAADLNSVPLANQLLQARRR